VRTTRSWSKSRSTQASAEHSPLSLSLAAQLAQTQMGRPFCGLFGSFGRRLVAHFWPICAVASKFPPSSPAGQLRPEESGGQRVAREQPASERAATTKSSHQAASKSAQAEDIWAPRAAGRGAPHLAHSALRTLHSSQSASQPLAQRGELSSLLVHQPIRPAGHAHFARGHAPFLVHLPPRFGCSLGAVWLRFGCGLGAA